MIETKINIRYKRKNKYINKTAITDIYTLSLHDALPISIKKPPRFGGMKTYNWEGVNPDGYFLDKLEPIPSGLTPSQLRSEERFSRNAETDIVCRLLLEKKKKMQQAVAGRN